MSYRCTVCRNYFRTAPYRRFGIVSVCSEECQRDLGGKPPSRRQSPPDIPEPVRADVRGRDQNRCRFCGRRSLALHEHHIHYRSEGVDHSPENLIVLCLEHHNVVHSDKNRWQPVCLAYIAELAQGRQRFLVEIDREINPPVR